MEIEEVFKKHGKQFQGRNTPLWQGPDKDGITVSLLSLFLVDRERFRLKVIKGIGPKEQFNHRLEYGNFWHVCEEAHARGVDPLHREPIYPGSKELTYGELKARCQGLCERFRFQQDQIVHWYNVCKAQFPVYLEYWSKHPEMIHKKPLLQEFTFRVPYTLPSGRTVFLRGKMDSVDYVSRGKNIQPGIWLQENKTKGDIRPLQLQRQLQSGFDLQTMFYMVALYDLKSGLADLSEHTTDRKPVTADLLKPIRGVRYNVIRRPLSGGKGTIVRHKPTKKNPRGESEEDFYRRLQGIIKDNPEDFFYRWNVVISKEEIERFKIQFLEPILEQLCNWWEWIRLSAELKVTPFTVFKTNSNAIHWRTPYGLYNPLLEGGEMEIDDYLNTGSLVGMEEIGNLFPELE